MALPATAPIPVVTPEGDVGTIDPSEWTQYAQAAGYRPATPEEIAHAQKAANFGTFGQGVKAAGEGALSALTLGAGPGIEQGFGVKKEDIQARKEFNPVAHGAGELAGTIAGLAIPGVDEVSGPALIGKAAKAVRGGVEGAGLAGAAGRILPAVAESAATGAAYGLQDNVEKWFLDDPTLSGEKVMAEVGLSALIPAVFTGVGKLVGEATRPWAEKLISKGIAAADTKAIQEAAKEEASLAGAARERTANAYRQMERVELALNNPALSAEDRAGLEAFKASPEYADLVKANARSVLTNAPEALAEREGARGVLAEFQESMPQQIAERSAELQSPERLGDLLKERIVGRYGLRSLIGSGVGAVAGIPGLGMAAGLSFGPAKDVIKRIIKDPSTFMTVGRLLQNPVETFAAMSGLSKLTGMTDKAIADGVGNIFSGTVSAAGAAGVGAKVTPENFTHVASAINNLGGNLDAQAQANAQQAGPLRPHAPATTNAITGATARGVAHLSATIPTSANRKALDPPYKPSKAELHEFNRRLEVMERPTKVLDHIAKGTLTVEHMQALQAAYPRLLQEMQQKAIEALAEHMASGKTLPHKARMGLGMLLGQDLDHSTTQGSLLASQQAVAMALPPQEQGNPNLGKIKMSGRLMTPTQNAATRGQNA